MIKTGRHLYVFGPFRVDVAERLFLRDDKPVAITAKAFDTLVVLLENPGHLVTKAELLKSIWPDTVVEEQNVAVTVSMLRKALGDEGPEHRYIKTVARQGYRFVAEIKEAESEAPSEETHRGEVTIAQPPLQAPQTPALSIRRPSRIVAALLSVAAALVISAGAVLLVRKAAKVPSIRTLAILPFQSNDREPGAGYLRLGVADALTTRLAATGKVVVRPTTAVLEYSNTQMDPRAIGRAQKVDAVVSGDIYASGDQVRLNLQLLRVADGSIAWAAVLEGQQSRILELEREAEQRLARALSIRLLNEEGSNGGPSASSDATRLYLEGRYFWNKRTEQGLRRSIEAFQRATIADPQYAAAFSGLADSYALLASYGVEPANEAYPNAKAAAVKAVELDGRLAEAHTSLAMISFYYEWDWSKAEKAFRRSLDLNPNYALAHTWYALELAALGRSDEALTQIEAAYRLDPLSLSINTEIGRVYYSRRDYTRAAEALRKVIDLDPRFARAHTKLGMVYAAMKDYTAALHEFSEARDISGPDPYLDGLTGYAEAMFGRREAARAILSDLTAKAAHQFVPSFSMALVCTGLGDRNAAFEWLSRSVQDRSTYMVYVNADPLLDTIRSDPRFLRLLEAMHLAR